MTPEPSEKIFGNDGDGLVYLLDRSRGAASVADQPWRPGKRRGAAAAAGQGPDGQWPGGAGAAQPVSFLSALLAVAAAHAAPGTAVAAVAAAFPTIAATISAPILGVSFIGCGGAFKRAESLAGPYTTVAS